MSPPKAHIFLFGIGATAMLFAMLVFLRAYGVEPVWVAAGTPITGWEGFEATLLFGFGASLMRASFQ